MMYDADEMTELADTHTPESLLPILQSITIPGNRDNLLPTTAHLLTQLSQQHICNDLECTALILRLLGNLLDTDRLNSETATLACKHAVEALQLFPEDRDILANGAAVIWICAATHATECLGEGAYAALEAASKSNHFANLEVGSRHPFRFKLGIVSAALSRLTET